MNAKVDYTLLDRWRASHAWTTRRRRHEAASAALRERQRNDSFRHDAEQHSGRVVHMPLAD